MINILLISLSIRRKISDGMIVLLLLHHLIIHINLLISNKDKKEALKFLPKLNSELMKVAKTGVIKKKNASRNISRITKKIKLQV